MDPIMLSFHGLTQRVFSAVFRTAFEAKLMPVPGCKEPVDALNSQTTITWFLFLYFIH